MATAASKARQPDLRRYYAHRLPEFDPADFAMELTLLRGTAPPLDLNPVTDSVDWADASGTSAMTGSLSLRRPVPDDPSSLPVGRGQRVRLKIKWGGSWYKLWDMRTESPSVDLSGEVAVDILDEMDMARRSQRDRLYRKDKAHLRGWTADQVVRHAARVDGIKLGKVAKGTKHITRLKRNDASFLDVARSAYQEESDEVGRRFVMRFRDGRFEVVPYQRNAVTFVFGANIIQGSVSREGTSKPVTAITGTARVGKGKGAQKIHFTLADKRVTKRFGYYHRERDYGRVTSAAALRTKVRRAYAESLRVSRKAQFTVPFTPFLRRGDAVMIDLPAEGYAGEDAFAFVTDVSHSIAAGSRQTTVSVDDVDVFFHQQEQREKILRDKKRKERAKRK